MANASQACCEDPNSMTETTKRPSYTTAVPWQGDPQMMAYACRVQGLGLRDFERQADMARMNRYRYGRLQAEMAKNDCAAALLMGSANVRYATGTRFAQSLQPSFALPRRLHPC